MSFLKYLIYIGNILLILNTILYIKALFLYFTILSIIVFLQDFIKQQNYNFYPVNSVIIPYLSVYK